MDAACCQADMLAPGPAGRREVTGRGMVLPFEPMTMTFKDVHYYVEIPKVGIAVFLCVTQAQVWHMKATCGTTSSIWQVSHSTCKAAGGGRLHYVAVKRLLVCVRQAAQSAH